MTNTADFENITPDNIIDEMVSYLLSMSAPAISSNMECMYRSPNGPCVVGYMIADEHYYYGLEDKAIVSSEGEVVVKAVESSVGFPIVDTPILSAMVRLQDLHDNVALTYGDDPVFPQMIREALKQRGFID